MSMTRLTAPFIVGLLIVLAAQAAVPVVPRFGILEVAFEAQGQYANPYRELEAEAELIPPFGPARRIPLFWDGGSTLRLRFSPDLIGIWRYTVRSSDAALDGSRGVFRCVPSNRRGSLQLMSGYPHHFQYQNGEACWFFGDTAWALFCDMPEERHHRDAAFHYLRTRASQGFTVVHSMLLSESGHGNSGGVPFHDIAAERLNPAYWQEVDARLRYANELGLVVGLALAWGDKARKEPWAWSRFPNIEARRRYARYVAARYGAFDVYFIVAGEWHAEARTRKGSSESEIFQEFLQIGSALQYADPHGRLIAIHPMSYHGSVREFAMAPWMGFGDYQQNYARLHDRALISVSLGRPVVNSEYGYFLRDADGDGIPDKDNSLSVEDMRHASWDVAMAGAYLVTGFGTTYFGGYRDPGPFDVDTPRNHPWEEQVQYLKRFFTQLEWWRLIPSDHILRCAVPRSNDRRVESKQASRVFRLLRPPETVYWAMQAPGEVYVVYYRGLDQPLELELDSRPGRFTVELYDPRTGGTQALGVTEINRVYQHVPRSREDWVLLLRRVLDR